VKEQELKQYKNLMVDKFEDPICLTGWVVFLKIIPG
jgi:hypothetical protein